MIIAIHPDGQDGTPPGDGDLSAPRWAAAIEKAGHEVRFVDVRAPDILEQLRGCQGFMWRWYHLFEQARIARRLLRIVERDLGLAVYPDQNTCWHYDDKILQAWLFDVHGIPAPKTHVFFDKEQALEWARTATWPLVLKLAVGAGASNVRLLKSYDEARAWVEQLFGPGSYTLSHPRGLALSWRLRWRALRRAVFRGALLEPPSWAGWNLQGGYALFQEFVPGNAYDTRVTVIGDRAFGFRRTNRPDDFRASGSGEIDWDPAGVDPAMVRLAYRTARALDTQSLAIDGIWRGEEAIVIEVSYTYASWAVHDCPGHWTLAGDPESGELTWHDGSMWPEDAQIQDFLARLEG